MPRPGLPSREECMEMIREWETPDNILRHVMLVNRIAVFLAGHLRDTGLAVDVDLVDRASLLHDLDKIKTLKTHDHGFVTEQYLAKKGYPQIGEIVRQHRFQYIKDPSLSWEAKLVNYADRRVKHDKIVTLNDRLDDLRERYHVAQRDTESELAYFQVEKDIFGRLRLEPDRLESYLK